MSDSPPRHAPSEGQEPLNQARIELYERLMEAQEQIAHALSDRGVGDGEVLRALDAAETAPTDEERRQHLYLSALSAYVTALGGRLEVHAVFPDRDLEVRLEP